MPVKIVPMSTDAAPGGDPLMQAMIAQRQQQQSPGRRMMEAGSRPQPVFNTAQGMMMLANGALGGFLEGRDERNQRSAQQQAGATVGAMARQLGIPEDQARSLQALAIINPAAVAPFISQLSQRMLNPPETFRQEDRPDGTRIQRSTRTNREEVVQQPSGLQAVSPGQMLVDPRAIRQGAAGQGAGTPPAPQPGVVFQAPGGYRPPTPEERRAANIRDDDRGIYQIGPDGKLSAVGTPQQNTTINNVQNPILKGMGEQFVEQRNTARSASQSIGSIHQARSLLESGITTGFGAERRLDLQRLGSALGITDPSVVSNTEAFRAVMGRQVLAEIKALGANPSNADREFAERIAAGSIDLNEQTLRRMLEIRETSARNVIKSYNSDAAKLAESMPDLQQFRGALAIQEPGSYAEFQAQQRAMQQQAPQAAPMPAQPQTAPLPQPEPQMQQPAPAQPMEFDFIPGQGLVPRGQQ